MDINRPPHKAYKNGYLQLKCSPRTNNVLMHVSARPLVVGALSPGLGVDTGQRRAVVGLAAADGVPDTGEGDAGHEDDGRVVHARERHGEGRGHGEEGDGEADPGWEGLYVSNGFWTGGDFHVTRGLDLPTEMTLAMVPPTVPRLKGEPTRSLRPRKSEIPMGMT